MATPRMTITSGRLSFAGIIAITVGLFDVIDGLAALLRQNYYLVTDQDILVFDYTAWGWIWLILGAVQIAIGAGILAGKIWARAAGVVLAVLAAIGHVAFLRAFPLWSLITIGLCVLLVYALTAPPRGARGA